MENEEIAFQINASVVKHKGKIWCTFRSQNLFKFNSFPFLCELDSNLNICSIKRLYVMNANTAYEDVRLFSAGDILFAFYTYFPLDPQTGWKWNYSMGYGLLDVDTGIIASQMSLSLFAKSVHEKNWVPYIFKGTMYLITSFDPYLRILYFGKINCNPQIEEFYSAKIKNTEWKYGQIRGGTPLLEKDSFLYGFVHSHLENIQGFERYYYYTAVRLNPENMDYRVFPKPLLHGINIDDEYEQLWQAGNQKKLNVIFPMGIMHHDMGVVVSFGKDDIYSYTQFFDWEWIKNLFCEDPDC